MTGRRRAAGPWVLGLALVLAVSACSGGGSPRAGSALPNAATAAHDTIVVIGDADALSAGDTPLHDSWPHRFFRAAPARTAALVNLAGSFATTTEAIDAQLPVATATHPSIALVWLGFDDIAEQVPAADFGQSLASLLAGLRSAGAHTLLVGSLPRVAGAAVVPYNAQLRAAVANVSGAVVVDFEAAPLHDSTNDDRRFVPADRDQPAIADAFERAYRSVPR